MGARVKPKIKNGQQAVLYALLTHFGGPTKMGKLLKKKLGQNVSRQMFFNWVSRGGVVPIGQVLKVSAALGVAPHALNYSEFSKFYTTNPSWKNVVLGLKMLSMEERKAILQKRAPQ